MPLLLLKGGESGQGCGQHGSQGRACGRRGRVSSYSGGSGEQVISWEWQGRARETGISSLHRRVHILSWILFPSKTRVHIAESSFRILASARITLVVWSILLSPPCVTRKSELLPLLVVNLLDLVVHLQSQYSRG